MPPNTSGAGADRGKERGVFFRNGEGGFEDEIANFGSRRLVAVVVAGTVVCELRKWVGSGIFTEKTDSETWLS